ncbi:MAG: hypothetical protein HYV42_05420 [Candidatus Magasanikbacteria bacterium]|nr:hypothetical protein [Candidatus Magasanikbacteria bacterium]
MPTIQHLPSAGPQFSATVGLGSFKHKLQQGMLTPGGELHLYKQHPKVAEALMNAVHKHQIYIKRGGLSLAQVKKLKPEITQADPTLTYTGKQLVRKTLLHLSRAAAEQKTAPAEKSPEAIARNLTRRRLESIEEAQSRQAGLEAAGSIYDKYRETSSIIQRPPNPAQSATAPVNRPANSIADSQRRPSRVPSAPNSRPGGAPDPNFRPVR